MFDGIMYFTFLYLDTFQNMILLKIFFANSQFYMISGNEKAWVSRLKDFEI